MATTAIGTTDPLECLPYEIWVDVFQFVVSDRPEGLLPYLAVSQKWNQTILEEPSLWTSIIIDDSADEDARICTFLYFSKDHLLDVTVMDPIARLDGIEAVLEQGHRIHSLTVSYNTWSRRMGFDAPQILRCLHQSATNYPRMRILDVYAPAVHYPHEGLIAKCPNIRVVPGLTIGIETILSFQLEEATTNPNSWDDTLNVLHRDNITSLRIECDRLGDNPKDLAVFANRLKEHISWKLKFLDINMEYPQLLLLSPLRFALRGLRTLTLGLFNTYSLPDNWEAPILATEEMQCLDNLTISFYYATSDRHSESIMKMFTTNKPFRYLKILDLETLEWARKIKLVTLLSLLHSVTGLRSLSLNVDLDLGEVSELDNQHVVMNDLLHLSLLPAVIMDYLEAPNAIDVELFAWDGVMTSLPDTHQLGNSVSKLSTNPWVFEHINDRWTAHPIETQWASLQCIEFHRSGRYTTVAKISSLQIIDFSDVPWRYIVGATMIDGLLQDLLQNHTACPHLHTIKSSQYPLWEPLFEVLRRRNGSGIPSLKLISLPGYPVLPILSPLVLLLQGRINVHTLVDVDDLIYQRFTDPDEDLLACFQCAAAGYTHCELIEVADVAPEDIKTGDLSLLDLHSDSTTSGQPDLGRLRKEIDIEDKIKRRDSFRSNNPRIICSLDHPCSRHRQTVDIAGFTLDGVSNPYAND